MEQKLIDFSSHDEIKSFFENELIDEDLESEEGKACNSRKTSPYFQTDRPKTFSRDDITKNLGIGISMNIENVVEAEEVVNLLSKELKHRIIEKPGAMNSQTIISAIKVLRETNSQTLNTLKNLMTPNNNESDPVMSNILSHSEGIVDRTSNQNLGTLGSGKNLPELEELRLAAEIVISEDK